MSDGSRSAGVVDLDGDAIPDLVTANDSDDDVSVLIDRCDAPGLRVELDIRHGGDSELNPTDPMRRGDLERLASGEYE